MGRLWGQTLMLNNLAASIEKWFVEQEDEFVNYGSDFHSYQYGNSTTAKTLIYTNQVPCNHEGCQQTFW